MAVRTTHIYCRASCPAITPLRRNVEFFRTAAAAQAKGYRACKRCRPDAAPGSPEWNQRRDVAARAIQLVFDGVVDRNGVAGLAQRLNYSGRHLNRLLQTELGAGPLALARAHRAQTARVLIRDHGHFLHRNSLCRRLYQHPPVQRHRPPGVRRVADRAAGCGPTPARTRRHLPKPRVGLSPLPRRTQRQRVARRPRPSPIPPLGSASR